MIETTDIFLARLLPGTLHSESSLTDINPIMPSDKSGVDAPSPAEPSPQHRTQPTTTALLSILETTWKNIQGDYCILLLENTGILCLSIWMHLFIHHRAPEAPAR